MTERVTELGRKTRQETVKWKPKTALIFQTGEDIRKPRAVYKQISQMLIVQTYRQQQQSFRNKL